MSDLKNDVVFMVSVCLPISNSSSPLSKSLEIIPSAQITIAITVNFMFHSCFSSLSRSKYISPFCFWFSFLNFFSAVQLDGEVYYPRDSLFLVNFYYHYYFSLAHALVFSLNNLNKHLTHLLSSHLHNPEPPEKRYSKINKTKIKTKWKKI